MPYCCQCGTPTTETDLYCAACGARQPVKPPAPLQGMSPRTASMICYIPIVGWIPAIIVLASSRFRGERDVRFHAFQSIYLFVAWLLVDWVIAPLLALPRMAVPSHFPFFFGPGFFVGGLLKLIIFGCWVFMLFKASDGVRYKLPLVGDLAERSVAEQR